MHVDIFRQLSKPVFNQAATNFAVLSDSFPGPLALLRLLNNINIPRRQNPNYVPATLNGLVMTMFHEDSTGEEVPFGVVVYSGKESARLPARGSAIVQAEVRKRFFPWWSALCLGYVTLKSISYIKNDMLKATAAVIVPRSCGMPVKCDESGLSRPRSRRYNSIPIPR